MKTNHLILFALCLILSGCGFDQFLRRSFRPPPDLTGGAKKAAALEFNVEAIDWGTQSVDSQNNYVIEVTNVGEEPATSLAASWGGSATGFSFRGGAFPGLGGDCSAKLSGGSKCKIIVTFRPPSLATFNAAIAIAASSVKGRETKTIAVTGKGSNVATLRASEDQVNAIVDPIDFGTRALGSAVVTKRIYLLYAGVLPAFGLTISGLSSLYTVSNTNCPSGSLNATCWCDITFTPSAIGTHAPRISLVYNNGSFADKSEFDVTATVPNGAAPGALSFNPSTEPYDFVGAVSLNRPITRTFLINNSGGYTVTVGAPTENPASPDFSASHNCTTLNPGATTCTLTVIFTPTTAGALSLNLDINITDSLGTRTVTRTYTGTGVDYATLSAPTLNVGTSIVGTPRTGTAMVSYFGSLPATAMSLTVGPTGPFAFSGSGSYPGTGSCAASLAGTGATCTIGFVFTPIAVGTVSQAMTLSWDDGAGTVRTANFTIQGTGALGADVVFLAASTAFGDTAINSKSDLVVSVRNNGGTQATGLALSGTTPVFGFANAGTSGFGTYPGTGGTCGATLNAVTTCTLVIRYLPTAETADTATLSMSSSSGTVTHSLSGTGKSWGRLVITAPPVPSVAVGSTSAPTTVTLSNIGVASITSLAIASAPANVSLFSTTCGSDIVPGASCTALYTVTPPRPGTFTHAIALDYQDDPMASGTKASSFNVTGPATIPMQLALGYQHSCLLLSSGDVKCWGNGSQGQLGRGNTATEGEATVNDVRNLTPINFGAGEKVRRIAAGGYFTCAILWDSNGVKCFGANDSGQLGIEQNVATIGSGAGQMGANLPFVSLGAGRTAVALAAGYAHTCVVLDNQTLKCWGANTAGQLGAGLDVENIGRTAGSISGLAALALNGTVGTVFAGSSNTCATVTSGSTGLKCWGDSQFGQLGNGNTVSLGRLASHMGASLPFMTLPSSFSSLSWGGAFLSIAFNDGTVEQIGRNDTTLGLLLGQNAADGVGPLSATYPLSLPGYGIRAGQTLGTENAEVPLPSVVLAQTVASGNSFTCSKFNDGKVRCWGQNDYGQLGQGSTVDRGVSPSEMGSALPVTSLSSTQNVAELAVGGEHACVILANQTVKCWGRNQFGQLGLGNTANRGDNAGEMGDTLPAVGIQ